MVDCQAIQEQLLIKDGQLNSCSYGGTINKLKRIERQMTQEMDEPTEEELIERMNLPVEKIREIIKILLNQTHDAPVGDEEDSTFANFIPDTSYNSDEYASTKY